MNELSDMTMDTYIRAVVTFGNTIGFGPSPRTNVTTYDELDVETTKLCAQRVSKVIETTQRRRTQRKESNQGM